MSDRRGMAPREVGRVSSALTEIDTSELSMVDRGAVTRLFALTKRQDEMGANETAQRILKADLDADMAQKFEAKLAELHKAAVAKDGAAPAMTPDVKAAVKGMLQLAVSYKDKLTPEHFTALAQLLGFVGDQAQGAASTASNSDDSDEEDEDEDGDTTGDDDVVDDPFATKSDDEDDDEKTDATGKKKGATEAPGGDKKNVGKRDGAKGKGMSKELEAFQKAADKKHEELRKQQEKIAKENGELRAKIRKQELLADVRKRWPQLGKSEEVAELVLDAEAKGISKAGLDSLLGGWNEQLKLAKVFTEEGADGEADSGEKTAEQQLRAIGEDLRKADPKLSASSAFTEACKLHPGLRVEMQKRHREIMKRGK